MARRTDLSSKTFIRMRGQPQPDTSIPIDAAVAAPPLRAPTMMRRAKTLTRPERSHPQAPMIAPPGQDEAKKGINWWSFYAHLVTFWAPPAALGGCGMKDKPSRQAWREKIALCSISLLLGGFVIFITIALTAAFCPASAQDTSSKFYGINDREYSGMLGIDGWMFKISNAQVPDAQQVGFDLYNVSRNAPGTDISFLFRRDAPSCAGLKFAAATLDTCKVAIKAGGQKPGCVSGALTADNLAAKKFENSTRQVGWGWPDIAQLNTTNYIVVDGTVLDMDPYMSAHPAALPNDPLDTIIRAMVTDPAGSGKDATAMLYTQPHWKEVFGCLQEKYRAGKIDKITPGCFFTQLVLYASLVIILLLIFVRFFMALYFAWFMAGRMTDKPHDHRAAIPLTQMPDGAVSNIDNPGTAPWAASSHGGLPPASDMSLAGIGDSPYIVTLVTCYSEGEEGINNTLASLSNSDYPDNRKLIFLVADGMVTGHGEARSTPDTCVGLLDADPRFGTPTPMSFPSVAGGAKAHNMAMVYAGHYTKCPGHRTPMVVVVKCGTPEEAHEAKPGNRGKRDSQMILMNFLQRCTFNDPMSPLDFDLFRKVHTLMGVTPDFFELCLMVDADTKVYPSAMRILADCMSHDPMIMGACGETRITNKNQSWVTMIQVFEYFISHHNQKAFESVFGGVTCLPGCFSIYRIKARKDQGDDWVPVIVAPEITREYSQGSATTLHQKNLLLLGEDRFLTTLMLRTFPQRKMVFCPRARCKTEVPDKFKMLLSQRRRWINSTVHNLMELVLVRDLCGTFCLSMQFSVFMDLFGTASLPVAIALTYTLIIRACINPPKDFSDAIPLMLLAVVLGLPGVLIVLATRKITYVLYMFVYLIALPVWNFILPVYSFWHFDDFSWGETRKVEGEAKGASHGDEAAAASVAKIPKRRWEEWERSRLRKLKREAKRRAEFEAQFGQAFVSDRGAPGALSPAPRVVADANGFLRPATRLSQGSTSDGSEAEDDRWGADIGGYDETQPPPPLLAPMSQPGMAGSTEMIATSDMAAILDNEQWSDDDEPRPPAPPGPAQPWQKEHSFSPYPPLASYPTPSPDMSTTSKHVSYAPLPSRSADVLPPAMPSYPHASSVAQTPTQHARQRSRGD